jgi:Mg-chelatase subunit ChlD
MKIFYTFIFMLLVHATFADGMKINGNIKDEDSKKNISNAIITLFFYNGVEFSATTDSLGNYAIQTNVVVPDGDYTIQINAENYYTLNGFIHVTKNAHFSFSLKQKNKPKTALKNEPGNEIKQDTLKPTLQGYATNNLLFLIDVSSSMNAPDRLPLLKESLKYLVDELRPSDQLTILTFSKGVEEILAATFINDKKSIKQKIDNIQFGSTTEGNIALSIAYKKSLKTYINKGNNRIIFASDGLLTSGKNSYEKIQNTIEDGLKNNISLSIFCFGKPTEYVKTKLGKLAQIGGGNYASISNIDDAKYFMLEEAKAVKE